MTRPGAASRNPLQAVEVRAEAGMREVFDEILGELGGLSAFDGEADAAAMVGGALSKSRYAARFREIIEAASLASADIGLGTFAVASADKYLRWRMGEDYGGVTLSATLRRNAVETAAILTDTIKEQLKRGGTWQRLAGEIRRHDKVADISATLADLARAGKKLGVDKWEINSLVSRAQRHVDSLSPGGAPTKHLKDAYQRLIDTVESKAGAAAIDTALREAMAMKVRYNAERISRTEIARAHNEGFHAQYDDNPNVTGYKWNLSSRHHIVDECTMVAELDNGQGPGVYRKEDTPTQPIHPNCMCMLLPHAGAPPRKMTFETAKKYLDAAPESERRAILGNRQNAAYPVGYKRGLARRGVVFGDDGRMKQPPPQKIPAELIIDRNEKLLRDAGAFEKVEKSLHSGTESSILDKGGDVDNKKISKRYVP